MGRSSLFSFLGQPYTECRLVLPDHSTGSLGLFDCLHFCIGHFGESQPKRHPHGRAELSDYYSHAHDLNALDKNRTWSDDRHGLLSRYAYFIVFGCYSGRLGLYSLSVFMARLAAVFSRFIICFCLMLLRSITPADNAPLAAVIRTVLLESGAPKVGTAYADPILDTLSVVYNQPKSAYFVVIEDGQLLGGAGIAPLEDGASTVCELQRCICCPLPEAKALVPN